MFIAGFIPVSNDEIVVVPIPHDKLGTPTYSYLYNAAVCEMELRDIVANPQLLKFHQDSQLLIWPESASLNSISLKIYNLGVCAILLETFKEGTRYKHFTKSDIFSDAFTNYILFALAILETLIIYYITSTSISESTSSGSC